jgi:L-lactate dehydrogenase complex protein LldF
MSDASPLRYRELAARAVQDRQLHRALAKMRDKVGRNAVNLYRQVCDGRDPRQDAKAVRRKVVDNLDVLLETLAASIRKRGGQVHLAETGADAVEYCLQVARRHEARRVVKGKSMLSEEIGLNGALEAAGIETVETDLGEYIVQLKGEAPSHIIAPAIHYTREQVGELFAEKLGQPYTDDPPTLTAMAREALREKMLTADMGISGGNTACAETGHVTIVSNEGNIRMTSTMPRVHIVLLGIEKIAATLEDHDILLRMLTRAAAGQKISTYVSYVGGPRLPDEPDGPEEFHLVLVDNGRSRILADPDFREVLHCVRCGGCLNVCPVYMAIGGHSYGSPYCGPIGAVFTPLTRGIGECRHLCQGETLCGACRQVCPVDVDLPRMLSLLRAKLADGDRAWGVRPQSRAAKAAFFAWSLVMGNRAVYDALTALARLGQNLLPRSRGWIRRLPGPLGGWTRGRDFPPLARESFAKRWVRRERAGRDA